MKDAFWKSLFKINMVAKPGRIERNKIRFGHHITTDGISVSVTMYRAGSGKEKEKKTKEA